jgi:hypothetical protein
MLEGSMMRIQRSERLVTQTLGKLPKNEHEARARLQDMLDFYSIAREKTVAMVSEWSSRKPHGR